ncbi:A/G-specific adenine glycosylase [Alkalihalobacillus macyae]|uniref:A/G-specific adenine glycosylase n=1 Tax=Guptibacillus hwajinpoensis TaxID=208199 RepID=UPI00273B5619|nr:A/G-specific adenine glycosylase [Alkalihalobacillus macyae]MDP4552279.1 A/G-specific adenine glycosylase [Alkalihalobacillus macyae]
MNEKVTELLHLFDEKQFQYDLITWYKNEQRNLPWRENQDPYRIWVSEIMLQQTRVDTVIPYFERFISKFPTIEALANAEESDVLKAWEGLGYYSRARNLQSAVREVANTYNSVVPNNPKEIAKLKGVGPYTAGAILSIAYNIPEPAVDGNVMRVLSRILGIWEDIAKPSSRKTFEEVTRRIISEEDPSSFNQGMMELGAIICTPKSPSCLLCPVQNHCRAFKEGSQEELPIKSKKKAPRPVPIAVVVLKDLRGKYLIRKRPDKGLLASLWEFPNVELTEGGLKEDQLRKHIKEEYDCDVAIEDEIAAFDHVFSHLKWQLTVYIGTIQGTVKSEGNVRLVNKDELEEFAFPVAHQKIVATIEVNE